MTGEQRTRIRQAIDQAKRQRIPPLCNHCGQPLVPHPNGELKLYCSAVCRKKAWMHTEKGRVYRRLRKQRQRAAMR